MGRFDISFWCDDSYYEINNVFRLGTIEVYNEEWWDINPDRPTFVDSLYFFVPLNLPFILYWWETFFCSTCPNGIIGILGARGHCEPIAIAKDIDLIPYEWEPERTKVAS